MTAGRITNAECRRRALEISEYLDGDLSPVRSAALQRHLESCECCTEFAASLRQAVLACREVGLCRLPEGVLSRARERVAALLGATGQSRA
jgi:anti-sigma factor RsiW